MVTWVHGSVLVRYVANRSAYQQAFKASSFPIMLVKSRLCFRLAMSIVGVSVDVSESLYFNCKQDPRDFLSTYKMIFRVE